MSKINTEIIIAVLSLVGTFAGSVIGALASSKLTIYRIEQLEKKVDKHNNVIERLVLLEHDVKNLAKFPSPQPKLRGDSGHFPELIPDA